MAPNRKTGQRPLSSIWQRQPGPVTVDPYGRPVAGGWEAFAEALAPFLSALGLGGGGGGHLHGVQRVLGDGATTTFDLLDFAEYVLFASDDGLIVDPALYTLSADRSQIVFTTPPTAGHVLTFNYVIAATS